MEALLQLLALVLFALALVPLAVFNLREQRAARRQREGGGRE